MNGGGVNCVLASVYQPQIKATKNIDKSTFQAETKHKSSGTSIDKDTMENLVVIVGVILGFFLKRLGENSDCKRVLIVLFIQHILVAFLYFLGIWVFKS